MEENQSLIGTLIFVFIYAVGGGALRGVLTGSYPLFFMHQTVYSYTILLITIGVFLVSNVYDYVFSDKRKNKFIKKIHVFFLFLQRIFLKYIFDVIDAVGLAAFIVFGVIAALEVKAKPLILWGPILAMVTTSGGGVLCNMLRSYKFDMTMKNMFSEISIILGIYIKFFTATNPYDKSCHN